MEKVKIHIEFDMKSTPVRLLWEYISSAPGLAKWFADDVEISGKRYTFVWDKHPQSAQVTAMRSESHIRLRWDDDETPRTYFEMRIATSDFSDQVTLTVTDFAEPGEEQSLRELWESQVEVLQRNLGC